MQGLLPGCDTMPLCNTRRERAPSSCAGGGHVIGSARRHTVRSPFHVSIERCHLQTSWHTARPLPVQARCVEPSRFSAALHDQNQRRDGGTVPDFAPATPPVHGTWLARNNRDEAILGQPRPPEGVYGRARSRSVGHMDGAIKSEKGLSLAVSAPSNPSPSTGQREQLVRAYRIVASLPRALALDVLA